MFFDRGLLSLATRRQRPQVLGLYSDNFLGEVRIKPFLDALLARGVIEGYRVADRAMRLFGPRRPFEFTHIWCERNVSTAQFRFLRRHADVPILYDLDDLLTDIPDFVMKTRARTQRRIHWCLHHARAVTVATDRLAASLREDVPTLSAEMIVLKNSCVSATPPFGDAPKKQLIWTSSDHPFFLKEHPGFIDALAELTNRAGYEVILIGRFDAGHIGRFARCLHIPYLDFTAFRYFLRSRAGAIGLAALPSKLPPQAQRFFDAKSDIKLVDYLSSGVVPVFSSAVPYATSELFMPELAAADGNELLARLEACIADPARMIEYVGRTIHAPGLLKRREFAETSKALDHLFA